MKRRDRQAYVLILPSLFTTGNLFCGFFSIIRSFNQDFEKAALAILVAGIFDVLDGRIARLTGSTSRFGVEYDSISDVVSFGIAPAVLAHVWLLYSAGNLGWAAAFFFAACGALRLARFNSMVSDESPKSYFVGLPIPAAAYLVASLAVLSQAWDLQFGYKPMVVLMFSLGLLMVSSVRYRSLKELDLNRRRQFFLLPVLVAALALIAAEPALTLFLVFAYYAAWGPVRELLSFVGRRLGTARVTAQPRGELVDPQKQEVNHDA